MWTKLRTWYAAANTLFPKQLSGEVWTVGMIISALVVITWYVLSRVFWYLRNGVLGFGYDTGIYRHIIQGYWDERGQNLPPFGFAHITNALRWAGLSTDVILIGGYLASACLLAWALYIVLQKQVSRRAGLLGVFVLTVSFTQIEFYHWFYYRNLLATALVLLAIAYHNRPWVSGFWLGLVGLVHPLSLIPVAIAFFAWGVSDKERLRVVLKIGGLAAVITFSTNWSEWFLHMRPLWEYRGLATLATASAPEFNGQFITLQQWLQWSWPYLILALPGFWFGRKIMGPLWWLLVIAGLGIAIQVLFYRRLIIWLDLAVIVAAVLTIEYLWQRWRLVWIPVLVFVLVGTVGGTKALLHYEPAMSSVDWLALQQLNSLPPKSLVLTITSQYAPWLYGYTDQRIVAPGMLDENLWNQEEWDAFWTTSDSAERVALLSKYPGPHLYIFLTQNQSRFGLLFGTDSRFTPLTSQIWQFDNPNYPSQKSN